MMRATEHVSKEGGEAGQVSSILLVPDFLLVFPFHALLEVDESVVMVLLVAVHVR